jgi:hypothetical protein
MKRFVRVGSTVGVLLLGLSLAGCEDFDPTAIFDSDFFNTKKKLPGERHPVFPEGTPGVAQGVPPELMKGYQPPPEPAVAAKETPNKETPKQAAAEPAESKPKPKPKAKPKAEPKAPEQATASAAPPAQPAASPQWPDPPQAQPAPASGAWPGSARPSTGVGWPDPPAAR